MSEHPILFSGEMVQAILEGRKTQTRRVMRPQPTEGTVLWGQNPLGTWHFCSAWEWPDSGIVFTARCPYGIFGNLLWVRETWATVNAYDSLKPSDIPRGDAGWPVVYYAAYLKSAAWHSKHRGKVRPSIHMPRWASRITLEVTGVRVERVQDISEHDAEAEGVVPKGYVASRPIAFVGDRLEHTAYRDTFHMLWDRLNAKRGYPWQSNPWVWAVTFKVLAPQPVQEED